MRLVRNAYPLRANNVRGGSPVSLGRILVRFRCRAHARRGFLPSTLQGGPGRMALAHSQLDARLLAACIPFHVRSRTQGFVLLRPSLVMAIPSVRQARLTCVGDEDPCKRSCAWRSTKSMRDHTEQSRVPRPLVAWRRTWVLVTWTEPICCSSTTSCTWRSHLSKTQQGTIGLCLAHDASARACMSHPGVCYGIQSELLLVRSATRTFSIAMDVCHPTTIGIFHQEMASTDVCDTSRK